MDPKISLEEFRHWLINPNERGFDSAKLLEPVTIPASFSEIDGGPCDRVCDEAPKLMWPALKALHYGGVFKKFPFVVPLPEDLEDQGMSLDTSEAEVIDSGYLHEWPVHQDVALLEEVYRHVKTFDNLPPKWD